MTKSNKGSNETANVAVAGSSEAQAVARGVSLPISLKESVEVCKYIKGKPLDKAKNVLEMAINLQRAIPFTRFNRDMGHKKGIAAGRFVPKTCSTILKLIKSAEGNAAFKGLNTSNLVVYQIFANKAAKPWRFGRHKRRKQKRAHVTVILMEQKAAHKASSKLSHTSHSLQSSNSSNVVNKEKSNVNNGKSDSIQSGKMHVEKTEKQTKSKSIETAKQDNGQTNTQANAQAE